MSCTETTLTTLLWHERTPSLQAWLRYSDVKELNLFNSNYVTVIWKNWISPSLTTLQWDERTPSLQPWLRYMIWKNSVSNPHYVTVRWKNSISQSWPRYCDRKELHLSNPDFVTVTWKNSISPTLTTLLGDKSTRFSTLNTLLEEEWNSNVFNPEYVTLLWDERTQSPKLYTVCRLDNIQIETWKSTIFLTLAT